MITAFTIIGVLIIGIGLISERLKGSMITAPMLCVFIGYLLGPVWKLIPSELDMYHEATHVILELTLIIVLFADACRVHIQCCIRQEFRIPIRLLTIGLLLSIFFGSGLGAYLFPAIGFWQAALMASVLAATDAALGQAVVESPLVPQKWRDILSLESGLNDGLVVPLIFFFKLCESATAGFHFMEFWAYFVGKQIGFGLLAGASIGYAGGKVLRWGSRAHAINRIFEHLSGVALALLAYSAAESIGGNGFVAVFVSGLVVANASREVPEQFLDFADAQKELLTLVTFVLFGALMVQPALEAATWQTWVYAGLMLTVVRIVAVAISLIGTDTRPDQVFLVGCFGPRGVASVLFGLLVLDSVTVVSRNEIFEIVSATVFISVFLHGLTAVPLAKWYGQRALGSNQR